MKRLAASIAIGTLLFSVWLAAMAFLFAQPETAAGADLWARTLASPLLCWAALLEDILRWAAPAVFAQASLIPLLALALPLVCLPFIAALSLPPFICLGWLHGRGAKTG